MAQKERFPMAILIFSQLFSVKASDYGHQEEGKLAVYLKHLTLPMVASQNIYS